MGINGQISFTHYFTFSSPVSGGFSIPLPICMKSGVNMRGISFCSISPPWPSKDSAAKNYPVDIA
jgi:hypothetical protein